MSAVKTETQPKQKLKKLFTTEPHGDQTVSWIRDDGDGSEPKRMCNESLISIKDSRGNEVVFTREELDSLATQWLKLIPNNIS